MHKIGIFGGTFDPFTKAHAAIVKEALKTLDEVWVIPTRITYYRENKKPLFDYDRRKNLIIRCLSSSAFTDNERNRVFLVDEPESASRTIDTLESLCKPDSEYHLIIGSDSFTEFKTWYRWNDILELVHLIVVDGRNGQDVSLIDIPHATITIPEKYKETSASKLRDALLDTLMDIYLEEMNENEDEH